MALGTASLTDIWRNLVLFRWRAGGNMARATYSRASTAVRVNQAGTGVVSASGVLRTEWVDLGSDGIREAPTTLLEGARTQLVTDPENFGAWSNVQGTPVKTSGQTDPFGGTAAYLIGDDDGAAAEGLGQTVAFTADATRAVAIYARPFGAALQSRVGLRDTSAATWRHRVRITWTGSVPSLATTDGAGALFTPEPSTPPWYRIPFNATGIVAANTNQIWIQPSPELSADTGSIYVFGANAWNAPFPASYQGPSGGATSRAADNLTFPLNAMPQNMTVLARFARPTHADAGASTALGVSPGIFSLGAGSAPRIGAYFDPAARNIVSVIDTATTDATQTTAIPAGTPLAVSMQFRNLTTGGSTALDVGSGLTAFSSAATAFSAFSAQTLRLGRYDDELFGGLLDLLIVRGLKTRQEMLAIAGRD